MPSSTSPPTRVTRPRRPVRGLLGRHGRLVELPKPGLDHRLQRRPGQRPVLDRVGQRFGRRMAPDRLVLEDLLQHLAPPGQPDLAERTDEYLDGFGDR